LCKTAAELEIPQAHASMELKYLPLLVPGHAQIQLSAVFR